MRVVSWIVSLPMSIVLHNVTRFWMPADVSIHLHVCASFSLFLAFFCVTSGILQLVYSPRIVVIMLILTTLEWCPLNVNSGKISVFLSTYPQSTRSLTFKSHVPVVALLSPHYSGSLKPKSSLQIAATWVGHFVGARPSMSELGLLLSSDREWVKFSPPPSPGEGGGVQSEWTDVSYLPLNEMGHMAMLHLNWGRFFLLKSLFKNVF